MAIAPCARRAESHGALLTELVTIKGLLFARSMRCGGTAEGISHSAHRPSPHSRWRPQPRPLEESTRQPSSFTHRQPSKPRRRAQPTSHDCSGQAYTSEGHTQPTDHAVGLRREGHASQPSLACRRISLLPSSAQDESAAFPMFLESTDQLRVEVRKPLRLIVYYLHSHPSATRPENITNVNQAAVVHKAIRPPLGNPPITIGNGS